LSLQQHVPTPDVAVVLICDERWFVPSFATALSARRHVTRPGVLVRIIVLDAAPEWIAKFAEPAAAQGISIVSGHVPEIEQLRKHHRDRYLPPVTLARFWIDRFFEPEIARFLYLDGDTLVDGNLDALLDLPLPAGGMLAAPDNVRLCLREWGRGPIREKAYLRSIGITDGEYFNAGVILADRSGWREIAGAAVDFLSSHPDRCRSSDQSALNAVTRGRRARLSLRYNYQSEHMIVFDPRRSKLRPVIWHFTGAPKPWHVASWPWDDSFNWAYREAERVLAGLGAETPEPIRLQLEAGLAHRRRARQRLRWLYPWRRLTRALHIRSELRAP
jgi:lipopolysaccharide biosynthesis glycosyltransferase